MREGATDGFTLIEMLVVLAIGALAMAALAYGPFGNQRKPTLAALARQIAVEGAALEAKAVARGVTGHIVVDPVARTITMDAAPLQLPAGVRVSIRNGVELIAERATGAIALYPDGTSSGGEILLQDSAGGAATVRVNWVTGAVEVAGPAP